MTATARIDAGIYAVMPMCRAFVQHVERDALLRRLTFFHAPHIFRDSLWTWVREGLNSAHCGKPVELSISQSMDVALAVGPHFGSKSTSAAELAGQSYSAPRILILRGMDPGGREACEQYAEGFLRGLMGGASGNVHLIMEFTAGEQPTSKIATHFQVIAFVGAMRRDEMRAYVSMRMLDRAGPGSSHLLRSLVAEFAGYDPMLAEQLLGLSDHDLLALPESLGQLDESGMSHWDDRSQAIGTTAQLEGSIMEHPLLLWRETRSGNPEQQAEGRRKLSTLYWRACVHAITPWLEERRQRVIGMISEDLELHRQRSGGKLQRKLGAGTKLVDVADGEVDYNTVAMFVYRQNMPADRTPTMRRVYDLCQCAKSVRDEIAHLRPPHTADLVRLIRAMDELTVSS